MKMLNFWRMATAVFAAGSIVYSVTSINRARRRGQSQQSGAAQTEFAVPDEYQKIFAQNMIIPAGWSFGVVWSTVYTGLGALLIHQALATDHVTFAEVVEKGVPRQRM